MSGVDAGTSTVLLADDRIVLSGYANNDANDDLAIVVLTPDGELDTSFGDGRRVAIPAGNAHDRALDRGLPTGKHRRRLAAAPPHSPHHRRAVRRRAPPGVALSGPLTPCYSIDLADDPTES